MARSRFSSVPPTCSIIERETHAVLQPVLSQHGTATARYGNGLERTGNGNFFLTCTVAPGKDPCLRITRVSARNRPSSLVHAESASKFDDDFNEELVQASAQRSLRLLGYNMLEFCPLQR